MKILSSRVRWLAILTAFLVAGTVLSKSQTVQYANREIRHHGISSVTMLFGLNADNTLEGPVCSGTYIGDGLVVTDYHCVACMDETPGSCEKDYKLKDGQLYNPQGWMVVGPTVSDKVVPLPTYIARKVAGDYNLDIAVLKIFRMFDSDTAPASIPIPFMTLGDSSKVNTGDTVYAIGYPERGKGTITFTGGYVAGMLDMVNPKGTGQEDTFKLDVQISPGNSGGLLMDDDGNQIGITYGAEIAKTGMINAARMINFAVPYVNQAKTDQGTSSGSPWDSIFQPPTIQPPSNVQKTKAYFGDIRFGFGLDSGKVVGQATEFIAGTKKVTAYFDYQGMQASTPWGWIWYKNGQVDIDNRNTEIWNSASSGTNSVYINNDDGLAPAKYSLELYVNNNLFQTGSFVVGNPAAQLPPQAPTQPKQDQGVVVKGRVIDVDTKQGIANAWVVFLKPTKTINDWNNLSIPVEDLIASSAYSDISGYFMTSPALARGNSYALIITAPGYNGRNLQDTMNPSDPTVIEYKPLELTAAKSAH
jgi:Trypsin-like peptidase domain